MKFNDLLESDSVLSCELITRSWETEYSWEWNRKEQTLTNKGKQQFQKLIESDFIILENGNIQLENDEITHEEIELFTGACAGYVDVEDYDEWFTPLVLQ